MPKGQSTPKAAITSLRKRAEAVAPGMFEAEIRHLFFLAGRLHKAVDEESEGAERDLTREFGLQLRATTAAVREVEEAAADRVVGAVVDWKRHVKEGGQ